MYLPASIFRCFLRLGYSAPRYQSSVTRKYKDVNQGKKGTWATRAIFWTILTCRGLAVSVCTVNGVTFLSSLCRKRPTVHILHGIQLTAHRSHVYISYCVSGCDSITCSSARQKSCQGRGLQELKTFCLTSHCADRIALSPLPTEHHSS